jgi:hypothetical protein
MHFRRPSNNKLYMLYNNPADAPSVELDFSEALAAAIEGIIADKRIVAAIAACQGDSAPEPKPGWVQPEAPPAGVFDDEVEDKDKPGFFDWKLP